MKKVIAILLSVVLVSGVLGSLVYAQDPDPNQVGTEFVTDWLYDVWEGDSFVGIDPGTGSLISVTGYKNRWRAHLHNWQDGTAPPVADLALALDSNLEFEWMDPEAVMQDPPTPGWDFTYGWSFGSVADDSHVDASAGGPITEVPVTFEPAFNVSRSFDSLFEGTDTQARTLTIDLTPGAESQGLGIMVAAYEDDLVSPLITGYSTPDPVNDQVELRDEGHRLDIRPAGSGPWTFTVTMEVTPKTPKIEFMPWVIVGWTEFLASSPEPSVDSSLSHSAAEAGNWTWSAEGTYAWNWKEVVTRNVFLRPRFEDLGNRVGVSFETSYVYKTEEDVVPNINTTQPAGIHANLQNKGDATGEDVVGLSPKGGPTLNLSTTQTLTYVKEENLKPGSEYTWEFPIIEQDQGFSGYAQLAQTATFWTGFSVERSVNQTSFPPEGGTQILTLSVTPEEAMDRLEINGKTQVGKLDIATFSSASGENIGIHSDGRGFHAWIDGIDESDIGTTYQWQITIDIAALPPELPEVNLEYMPFIQVRNINVIDDGGFYGSSPPVKETLNLDETMVLGTWTWQATGEYSWWWDQKVSKEVQLEGYAEVPCNEVGLNYETTYTYRTTHDEVHNINTTQPAGLHSNLNNKPDSTGEGVVGPSPDPLFGPVLDLSTTEEVTGVKDAYLVPGSEYTWEFPVIEQDQGFNGYAEITQTATFDTGFYVSRSADPVRVPAGGTQTLTLTVIPEETMQRLTIDGRTDVDGLDIATITSASGPNIGISGDGRGFHARIDGIDESDVGQTYQWQVTIEIVDPLPEEFLAMEFMPRIWVKNVVSSDGGSYYGSSPPSGNSCSLDDGGAVLGTWTWQATGDYWWKWDERVSKQVELDGYAVHAYVDAPTQEAINQAIDDGLAWLRSQQHGDGSWYWASPGEEERPSVGMTGLAVWSLIHGLVPPSDPAVSAGIDFILSQQVTDQNSVNYGAIYSEHPTYETGIAILALRATNDDAYLPQMTLAADYLVRSQNDVDVVYDNVPEGCEPENPAYGGWSYNYGGEDNRIWVGKEQVPVPWYVRADLSCTQFAMIGLKAAEEAGAQITEDDWANVWDKAATYVSRCQNPDGGFTYQPQDMPGGGGGSYGSMTAAGVWCLRLSDVPVEDDRVTDGLAWLDCHPFYDRNPPGSGTHNHFYFLWTAAKAFSLCDRPAELTEGTWYYDYAGYLLAYQQENGQWHNPQYLKDMDDRESHLNRTEYALLLLERAVLPPPPGIDLIGIEINSMKILFDRSPNRDNIEVKARLWLEEGASYNLDEDYVRVIIDGVVKVIIPPGSFIGSAGKYEFKLDGEPKVGMKLNFNDGTWSLKVELTDASGVDNRDGVNIALAIGDMFTGEIISMFCNDLVYP